MSNGIIISIDRFNWITSLCQKPSGCQVISLFCFNVATCYIYPSVVFCCLAFMEFLAGNQLWSNGRSVWYSTTSTKKLTIQHQKKIDPKITVALRNNWIWTILHFFWDLNYCQIVFGLEIVKLSVYCEKLFIDYYIMITFYITL